MVERIEKKDHLEYWQVDASAESKKEQGGGGQESEGRDAFEKLHDKTDWQLLFDKSRLWKKNIQIPEQDIDQILFRKLNLKTDPSLLRVDMKLKSGESVSPAFLTLARAEAFKIKHLATGQPLPLKHVLQGKSVWVTLPSNPKMLEDYASQVEKKEEETQMQEKEESLGDATLKTTITAVSAITNKLSIEIVLVYGVLLVVIFFLIAGFVMTH